MEEIRKASKVNCSQEICMYAHKLMELYPSLHEVLPCMKYFPGNKGKIKFPMSMELNLFPWWDDFPKCKVQLPCKVIQHTWASHLSGKAGWGEEAGQGEQEEGEGAQGPHGDDPPLMVSICDWKVFTLLPSPGKVFTVSAEYKVLQIVGTENFCNFS